MILHFGLDFDGIVHAPPAQVRAGELFVGPKKLLHWLETHLGLTGYPENSDYLRIELYRQALGQYAGDAFFAGSFESDRFATAVALLAWRDELLLAGWDFPLNARDCPPRLHTFAQVETAFRKKLADPELGARAFGWADRFRQALEMLETHDLPATAVFLYEPLELQPPHLQRLLQVFQKKDIPLYPVAPVCAAAPETNLGKLQRRLTGASDPAGAGLPDDYSVLILKSRRDSDAAVAVSKLLEQNRDFRPLLLIPELDRTLEQAAVLEQFPAMGVLSASLARPSLQVLKLAPVFLWEPADVFKIMEFVTLSVKPLDDGLALEIARVLAEKPGLFSDTWYAAALGYLEQPGLPPEVRRQYEFWFDRRRYRTDTGVPVRDVIGIYAYLHTWALQFYDRSGGKNPSLLVLSEQARRIRDLLEALPEPRLSFLELERIVRTIYEPAPVQLVPAEAGHFGFVHQPGALAAPAEALLWWNCLFTDLTPPPDQWRLAERQWLNSQEVVLDDPRRKSRRALLRQQRPVLQTCRQLVLLTPAQANGIETVPSLLLGDIEAAFGAGCAAFTFDLDDAGDLERLARHWRVPESTALDCRPHAPASPFLQIDRPDSIPASAYETPTNLESLFYYPHRWFFRQKMKLYATSLLSVTGDTTLLGSLAHRFFEILLKENLAGLDKAAVAGWVDDQAKDLLNREGATLLLYGREPERNAFLNKVKNAAWSLISLLRANDWTVEGTEIELRGEIAGMPVQGKADLVLRRGDECAVVDLKWSGARRRREMIQNGEDLQLVLYARLLPPEAQWAHTAYFILDEGKMIARNRAAFRDAMTPGTGEADHVAACAAIFEKMEKTFAWRLEQLRQGRVELRSARTAPELEGLYADEALFDLLEMKNEDARWDDYRTLLQPW